MFLSNDEVVKRLAKKLDLPEEQVFIVINDLWAGIKHYFYHPHTARTGVMINKFVKFKLRYNKIIEYINYLKTHTHASNKYPEEYWSKVLNNIEKNYGNRKRRSKGQNEEHHG